MRLTDPVADMIVIVAFIVYVERSERRIPVQYAKRVIGRKVMGGGATHLPLRVNAGGVMPVIFASSILTLPQTIGYGLKDNRYFGGLIKALGWGEPLYTVLYAVGIIFFAYFYISIVFNPNEVADNMFWAQPFERGFGTTIGNALRRVLLSSIEGAAVTAVKIEGVLHEFQSIPGVVEDATDIILNLKQIPFKLSGDAPKAIYLRADTPGVVTSGMIEADADVEVLDKDVYIATVSEGGKLDMEMRLKRGRGYVSADKNFDEDLGIGFIPIDSVHSPVRKCNYTVEAARLGQITDYDKLTLEVWTNGSITPADALGLAAKLVKDHMPLSERFTLSTSLACCSIVRLR